MDEIHQWKNGRALYDIIADGVTAREQPLIFMTSTAGTIREDIYDEEYDEYYCMQDLDEDEYYRIMTSKSQHCPYYRQGDDYYLARKQ